MPARDHAAPLPRPAPHAMEPTRVACVGDSLTFGHSTEPRDTHAYPAVLGQRLGPNYDVRNFGHNGATMLRDTGRPYRELPAFQDATAFDPHLVLLMLGTNDASGQMWTDAAAFRRDAAAMVQHFVAGASCRAVILLCPPRLPAGVDDDRRQRLEVVIKPLLREVAARCDVMLADLSDILDERVDFAADRVHPNNHGSGKIADACHSLAVWDALAGGDV